MLKLQIRQAKCVTRYYDPDYPNVPESTVDEYSGYNVYSDSLLEESGAAFDRAAARNYISSRYLVPVEQIRGNKIHVFNYTVKLAGESKVTLNTMLLYYGDRVPPRRRPVSQDKGEVFISLTPEQALIFQCLRNELPSSTSAIISTPAFIITAVGLVLTSMIILTLMFSLQVCR